MYTRIIGRVSGILLGLVAAFWLAAVLWPTQPHNTARPLPVKSSYSEPAPVVTAPPTTLVHPVAPSLPEPVPGGVSPGDKITPVPGGYTYASPTIAQQAVNGCPASGVITEEHGSQIGQNDTSEWQNFYCGSVEPGYCWAPPMETMPGQPVQTGLDYAKEVC